MNVNFEEYMKQRVNLINNRLDQILKIKWPEEIYQSMRYSVFAGGKRLRPLLTIMSYDIFSQDIQRVLDFACAIELIHTYSLIHDDLPAMDNDDLRRGMPTNHKMFGEAVAILTGDALLNLSMEVVFETIQKFNFDKDMIKACSYIFRSSGVEGMIAGQVLDILNQGKSISKDELFKMHELKTAKLIQASCVAGAIIGGADTKDIMLIEKFAYYLGIAFQIRDDILDYIGEEKDLGKSTKKDFYNEKPTFVSLYGIDKSQEYVEKYSSEAQRIIETFDKNGYFCKLIEWLIRRNK